MTLMKDKIRLLAGAEHPQAIARPVFDELVIDFLDALSDAIRADTRLYPIEDIAAFGFWCRRQHLLALKKRHDDGRIRMGRGMAFHLPPANVPAMFAYSMAISMLAGNSNIVRVSARTGETGERLCHLIDQTLHQDRFREICETTSLIMYDRDEVLTRQLLQDADVRIIWGSDETVRQMMAVPAKCGAVSECFPDHWSMALLSMKALSEMDDEQLQLLVRHFYNDTYVMDQLGCSSPQLVAFLDDGGVAEARDRFWRMLGELADESYAYDAYKAARRYERLTGFLLQYGDDRRMKVSSSEKRRLQLVTLSHLPEGIREYRGGFGLFYTVTVTEPKVLAPVLGGRLQTLVCEGIDRQQLQYFFRSLPYPAVCRVVSPGEALMMGTVWDGRDLIAAMSVIIDL